MHSGPKAVSRLWESCLCWAKLIFLAYIHYALPIVTGTCHVMSLSPWNVWIVVYLKVYHLFVANAHGIIDVFLLLTYLSWCNACNTRRVAFWIKWVNACFYLLSQIVSVNCMEPFSCIYFLIIMIMIIIMIIPINMIGIIMIIKTNQELVY